MQVGTPLHVLRQATNCERSELLGSDEGMEKEIFSRLPDNIHSFSWTRDRKDMSGGAHVHFAEDASTGMDLLVLALVFNLYYDTMLTYTAIPMLLLHAHLS